MNFDKKEGMKIEIVYFEDIFSKEPILMKLILKPIKHVTLGNNYKRRKILNWNSSLEYYKENLIETYNKIFE